MIPPEKQQVAWILLQHNIDPVELTRQYVAHKKQREAFEAGYGTVDDMTAAITPPVADLLRVEDQMAVTLPAEETVQRSGRIRAAAFNILALTWVLVLVLEMTLLAVALL